MNDHTPMRYGTRCVTLDDNIIIQWRQRKFQMTVPIDKAVNVGTFHLATGYQAFQAFCIEAGFDDDDDHNPVCFPSTVVSDDEGDDDSITPDLINRDDDDDESVVLRSEPLETPFDITPDDITTEHVVEPDEEDKLENLSAQLLRLHHKHNHISFHKLQHMARRGILPKKLATCTVPICSACLYGKATRRAWRGKPLKAEIRKTPTIPGEVVSVDQMKSPTAGLVAQLAGGITNKRYIYATIFVDHATGFGYVHLQKTQSAKETLEAKQAFERYAAACGVQVLHYHADNGVFDSQAWRNHCSDNNQGLTFAAVGAHHQNGRAERRIRELQELARAMLIHASKRWPTAINAHLWPYAIRMANDSYNEAMSRDGSISPVEKFSRSMVRPNPKFSQPFGCPCYVLNEKLQSVKGLQNKWKERSRVGVYLGRSPQHARSVALVLNLTTGHVSPQFHVAFDPSFQTVKDSFGGQQPPSLWQQVCGFEEAKQVQSTTPSPSDTPSVGEREQHPQQAAGAGVQTHDRARSEDTTDVMPSPAHGPIPTHGRAGNDIRANGDANENLLTPVEDVDQQAPEQQRQIPHEDNGNQNRGANEHTPTQRRSTRPSTAEARRPVRQRRPVQRLIEVMTASILAATGASEGAIAIPTAARADPTPAEGEIFCLSAVFPAMEFTPDEHPLEAYGATADPDTLYYHEAMREPDRDQFKLAMVKEFGDQMDNGNFSIIHKSKVPEGAKILPSVWAMRRKRKILTGEIYKWKARLNLDGSKQVHGQDFWQTYAPVATWSSIRLLLILSLIHSWHTVQIDYVQAYPQAPINKVQYMKLPRGIEIEGIDPQEHVLEVHKNVYGGKDSGRTWNKYLVEKLTSIGFKQSLFDECVFYKGKAMYVLYTDDSILAGPDKQELDSIIAEMKSTGLDLTAEGGVADFLGVHISKQEDNTYLLSQPKLIDSILHDLGLDKSNTSAKATPAASSKLLSRHPNSENFDGHFHYRRAIGKLNFLEKSTRADIAYAVHQCARFSQDPKVEHGNAVKWIGRYLAGTRDKGLILKPDPSKGLEVYCDADFAGAWDKELAGEDIDTARSRHGYIIMYAGCPIVWQSQLQSEIALSSTESELIGLSMALRAAIPMMNMLNEMKSIGFDIHPDSPKVHCKLFEDNNGALEIAKVPKQRPRTKHINCKYFHFTSYVANNDITLHRIDTAVQPADVLTKPNELATFVKHRKFILGW